MTATAVLVTVLTYLTALALLELVDCLAVLTTHFDHPEDTDQ